jgi:hypothetical protein
VNVKPIHGGEHIEVIFESVEFFLRLKYSDVHHAGRVRAELDFFTDVFSDFVEKVEYVFEVD